MMQDLTTQMEDSAEAEACLKTHMKKQGKDDEDEEEDGEDDE